MIRLLRRFASLFPCREIRDLNGTLYLQRFRIVGDMMGRHAWFPLTVYLHRFERPDHDRHLHNHPWPWAVSLVLAGGYDEVRQGDQGKHVRCLRAGDWNLLRANTFHTVAKLKGETWTLFIVGRKVQSWGFAVPGRGVVEWRQYHAERVAALRGQP